ncbi:hypothetical protein FOA52_006080 [Chlamydomonas sp. UWO 241]|nr:hypothetical protein FOA52_006080 [Chlamydomonas sp. UWO 241]
MDTAPVLRRIGPHGWVGAAAATMITVPIVALQGAKYVYESYTKRAVPCKDRTTMQLPDPMPGLVRQMVEVAPGVRLQTVSPGRQPTKPLMLMLHGFPESWYSWRHQLAEFRDEYDVVAIDMRG